MIVLDTSVWIEFLKYNQSVYAKVRFLLEERKVLGVEPVFGELLQGVKNEREKSIIQEFWHAIPKRSEQGLWIETGQLSANQKLFEKGVGLIDAALLAFALRHDAQLWTLDSKLNKVIQTNFAKYLYI